MLLSKVVSAPLLKFRTMGSDTNGWVLTRGQKHPLSVLARTTVEWKLLIGTFDYPTLLTLRHRHSLQIPLSKNPDAGAIFGVSEFSTNLLLANFLRCQSKVWSTSHENNWLLPQIYLELWRILLPGCSCAWSPADPAPWSWLCVATAPARAPSLRTLQWFSSVVHPALTLVDLDLQKWARHISPTQLDPHFKFGPFSNVMNVPAPTTTTCLSVGNCEIASPILCKYSLTTFDHVFSRDTACGLSGKCCLQSCFSSTFHQCYTNAVFHWANRFFFFSIKCLFVFHNILQCDLYSEVFQRNLVGCFQTIEIVNCKLLLVTTPRTTKCVSAAIKHDKWWAREHPGWKEWKFATAFLCRLSPGKPDYQKCVQQWGPPQIQRSLTGHVPDNNARPTADIRVRTHQQWFKWRPDDVSFAVFAHTCAFTRSDHQLSFDTSSRFAIRVPCTQLFHAQQAQPHTCVHNVHTDSNHKSVHDKRLRSVLYWADLSRFWPVFFSTKYLRSWYTK